MKISKRTPRFVVSIYLADAPVNTAIDGRLSIPLTCLFTGTTVAEDGRMAAARKWIQHVGKYRRERLVALAAPQHVYESETEAEDVAMQLKPSSICPGDSGYLFDNFVEAWFISVRPVQTNGSGADQDGTSV